MDLVRDMGRRKWDKFSHNQQEQNKFLENGYHCPYLLCHLLTYRVQSDKSLAMGLKQNRDISAIEQILSYRGHQTEKDDSVFDFRTKTQAYLLQIFASLQSTSLYRYGKTLGQTHTLSSPYLLKCSKHSLILYVSQRFRDLIVFLCSQLHRKPKSNLLVKTYFPFLTLSCRSL